jgi:UDP-N-acetyl-2-amino-2-deoxyglucuronate dehydrogenase
MGKNTLRTALVGCGKVGQIHAQALRSLAESNLVAACDADPDRAGATAARYGGAPFTDVEAMLRAARPEVVFVCTPHPLHVGPVVLAASSGAHVLVEKPMAASLDDCDAMLAAARKAGVTLGVVSQRRWCEPVLRMKRAIDDGKIGRPVLGVVGMFNWRDEAYYRSDPWRGRWDAEGGGVLVNQAPHQLDLLQWMMGEPEEISGLWANVNHPSVEVDDTAVAVIRFASGGLGSVVASVGQKPGLFTKVHVHGSTGAGVGVETDRGASFVAGVSSIVEPPLTDLWNVPGEEHLLDEFRRQDREAFARVDATAHYHALQVRDFLRAALEGRPPLVTGEHGRRVVAMFAAVYRSQREGRPVRVSEPAGG